MQCRLQAIATPLVQSMEKVQIIPAPKDVDPRALVWKGAAVLGKMDGAADLWITPQDWVCFMSPPRSIAGTHRCISGHLRHARVEGEVFLLVDATGLPNVDRQAVSWDGRI